MITYRQPFQKEYPITQLYGEKITSAFHTGIDYGCPQGTPILASADGTVMYAGWDNTGYGRVVIIQHDDGRATLYAHLMIIVIGKSQGTRVKQGEKIALSGNTGNVTGPHLHFEARRKWDDYKSHFDPMLLPLMSMVDENAGDGPVTVNSPKRLLPSGVYRVACDYAFVRNWKTLTRENLLNKGERVYAFDDVKWLDDLPFHFIGAGRCIAEYDADGTIILEAEDGKEN